MKNVRLVKFKPQRTFGIEMEWNSTLDRQAMKRIVEGFPGQRANVTSYQRNDDATRWFCKADASCGHEVATKVLGSLTSVQQTLDDLKLACDVHKALYDAGARVSDTCGGHVHVGMGNLSEEQVDRFLMYWIKMEKVILDIMPRRRVNNQYCMPHSNFFNAGTGYNREVLRRGFSSRAAVNLGHYSSGSSDSDRRVIEIRIGEASNDYRHMKNWVRFVLYFIELVKDLPNPTNVNWYTLEEALEMLELTNKPTAEEFLVLSPAINELREWILARTAAYAKFRDARNLRARAKKMLAELHPKAEEISAERLP